ncbi:MAG: FG-GAP repeat protein [Bdellovibrionaceae bacterium]|nr:FG-GAP repeat protein [Pseudobdellovibrionaceae bacterium]
MKLYHWLLVLITALNLVACSDSGVQGTSLYSAFKGLSKATPISPTAVRLNWGLDSKYAEYRIYENDGASPIKTETFSTVIVADLQPGSTYSFMVSGYSSTNGETFLGERQSVKTFDRFAGIEAAGVVVKSSSEVKLSWKTNSETTKYKIYYKVKADNWSFTAPNAMVEGANEYTVSGLTSGASYCFYIVASYQDETSEPAVTDIAAVNAGAPCIQLTTQLVGLPSVNINNVVPGTFPWFWASNGDPSYKTEIYEGDTNIRVATRTGNGTFRAFVNTSQGSKRYYALVSDASQNVARVEVGSIGTVVTDRVSVRSLNATGNLGPIYPPVLAGGRGQQNLGNSIVSGDFNCDGLTDIAVASYNSVPFVTDRHYTQIGSVSVYYTWQPPAYLDPETNLTVTPPLELKTDVAPAASAVFPNAQLITYPVTVSAAQIGKRLSVGNFNGDCYNRNVQDLAHPEILRGRCDAVYMSLYNPSASKYEKVKTCDDLVIATSAGYFYTVFGDPVDGLVTGSMSNTAGEDELTCDASSSTCRAARYTTPATYANASFGNGLTTGDYNNDGYSDIAVSAVSGTRTDVLVYRGSPQGIIPHGNSKSHAYINPLVGVATNYVSYIPLANKSNTEVVQADRFGVTLGTAYNSRYCVNNSPAGYVFRTSGIPPKNGYHVSKCDDLVIGSPGRSTSRGSIYTCKATIHFGSADPQRISQWTCLEHYPSDLVGTDAQYGLSIMGVKNQNGYPMATNIRASIAANALPDVTGALFVGAPYATFNGYEEAGKVYGYYVTPTSANYSSGGIQGILGSGSHAATAVNTIPCDATNTNVINGSLRQCEHQIISASPVNAWARFGYSLGTIPDRIGGVDPWMPMLAVSAPYRTTTDSSGNSIASTGSVFLFRGDISTFMNQIDGIEEITVPKYNADVPPPGNPVTGKTWYSGGVSPYGPNIIYPTGLTAYSYFGMGGIVGGSFNGDTYADVISTAMEQNSPSSANGGMYGFFSSQGTFNPSVSKADIKITENHSLEGNYRFEEAQVVGDLNGDGYDDVVSHLNNNGRWVLVVYYGSSMGLVKTPAPSYTAVGLQPKLVRSVTDSMLGAKFYRIGDNNADGFDDLLVLGSGASYIYFGSSSGLVTLAEPDISPIGKNPLKFALSGSGVLQFNATSNNVDSYPTSLDSIGVNSYIQGVAYGRYNDDEYSDFAIRIGSSSLNVHTSVQNSNLTYTAYGRVFIVYGGASGPNTNRVTGRITMNNPDEVVVDNPCDTATKLCKVQMLASFDNTVGGAFGFGLATRKGSNSATSDQFDGLVITNPTINSNDGRAYVYKGSIRGLEAIPIQTLVSRNTGSYFGYSVVEAGDINRDGYADLVIGKGSTDISSGITVFYGAKVGGQNAYYGAGSLASTNFWAAPAIDDNARHTLVTNPRPQVIVPNLVVSGDEFGRGIAAVGDFNLDGYADVAMNVSNGDFTLSGTLQETGYVLVYFGSETGLQSMDTATNIPLSPTPYPRCYGGTTSLCEPFQVFLPNAIDFEYTLIGPHSVGDINGDGLNDLLVGGYGRNHPSGKAISSGVLYVLY